MLRIETTDFERFFVDKFEKHFDPSDEGFPRVVNETELRELLGDHFASTWAIGMFKAARDHGMKHMVSISHTYA